jgi:hypothetical protein
MKILYFFVLMLLIHNEGHFEEINWTLLRLTHLREKNSPILNYEDDCGFKVVVKFSKNSKFQTTKWTFRGRYHVKNQCLKIEPRIYLNIVDTDSTCQVEFNTRSTIREALLNVDSFSLKSKDTLLLFGKNNLMMEFKDFGKY